MSPIDSLNQNINLEQLVLKKEDLVHLITNNHLNHPALSRISMRLGAIAESGVESKITSYDRMHHRHNRS